MSRSESSVGMNGCGSVSHHNETSIWMLNDETESLMRVTSLVQYIAIRPGISSTPVKNTGVAVMNIYQQMISRCHLTPITTSPACLVYACDKKLEFDTCLLKLGLRRVFRIIPFL